MAELIESISSIKEDDNLLVEKAVELSLIEIVIGSLLHNLSIPFTGHFLSLNQGYFYSFYLKGHNDRIRSCKMLIELSIIVSLMKSLSPSLKKLGPMMSISIQGFLYSIGVAIFGVNLLGQILGSMLLSLWAFIQPLISLFALYGFDLVQAYGYYEKMFNKFFSGSLSTIILIFIALKLLLATMMPVLALFYPPFNFLKFSHGYLSKKNKKQKKKSLFKELTRPLFVVSFLLMFSFFFINEHDQIIFFQKLARVISLSLLFIFLVRSKFIRKWIEKLLSRSQWGQDIINKAELAYAKILTLS